MKSEKHKLQVRKQGFQKKVLSYYRNSKRDLPWRKTRDPYRILVSEVMLQQTQTERVIHYYTKFLEKYPDVFTLAQANLPEALALWSGLGYSRRLLNLIKLAGMIVEKYSGRFPGSREELRSLPGIGDYTSAAIIAFWLNRKSPVIDTNIRKVYTLEFPHFSSLSTAEQEEFVYSFIPDGKSRVWNNALMDYAKQFRHIKLNTGKTAKQKPFKGSEREVRGKVLRLFLERNSATAAEIMDLIDDSRLEKVLSDLENEGFLQRKRGRYGLSGIVKK